MISFGYDHGVFAGVVVTDDFVDTLNLRNNSPLLSTVTAIYDIGCFFGAIMADFTGDILGRKHCHVRWRDSPDHDLRRLASYKVGRRYNSSRSLSFQVAQVPLRNGNAELKGGARVSAFVPEIFASCASMRADTLYIQLDKILPSRL